MTAVTPIPQSAAPAFCEGIQHFGDSLPGFDQYGKSPTIASGKTAIAPQESYKAIRSTKAPECCDHNGTPFGCRWIGGRLEARKPSISQAMMRSSDTLV